MHIFGVISTITYVYYHYFLTNTSMQANSALQDACGIHQTKLAFAISVALAASVAILLDLDMPMPSMYASHIPHIRTYIS